MQITFTAPLWKYQGKGAWYFLTLPPDMAAQVRFATALSHHGFGSVRVRAQIGDQVWKTSVFPDKSSASYLLPVKADIRARAGLTDGDAVAVALTIDA